jgi:hypothetical protein
MALPASGPISMSMLRTELLNEGKTTNYELSKIGGLIGSGTNTGSGYVPINRSSTSKPDDNTIPSQISEWYSYDHSANQNCPTGDVSTPTIRSNYLYYRVNVTGSVGSSSAITLDSPNNTLSYNIKCRIYTTYPFTNTGTLTGSPVFDGTFTNTTAQVYNYTLSSTSQVLHIVIWDEGGSSLNQFNVYALSTTSCSDISNQRIIRTSNNDATLAAASANSSTLYRLPQDVLLTGFNYVRDDNGSIYSINSTTAIVGALVQNC